MQCLGDSFQAEEKRDECDRGKSGVGRRGTAWKGGFGGEGAAALEINW